MGRLAAGLSTIAACLVLCAGAPPPDPDEIGYRTTSLPPDLRLEVSGLQYLLTPEEIEDLLRLPRGYRVRRWIDRWWRDRDPVYTTDANEVRVQHAARVAQAREWFRSDKWPGWDQRGEVQIRYGTPAWRQIIGPDVGQAGYKRPGELWYYPALGMYVMFEDAFGSGNYTYYIEHVKLPVGNRPRNDRLATPSGELPDGQLDFKAIDANFNAMLNGLSYMPNPSAQFARDSFFDMLLRFLEVLESHPAMFPSDFDFMKLPLYYRVNCFRAGEGIDRFDVNAQFRADPRAPEGVAEKVYHTTAVVWDKDGKEVARGRDEVSIPATDAEDPDEVLEVSQISFTLRPDFYRVAVTVEEELTARFASERWDATCRSFDPHLAISDIVCAGRIAPASSTAAESRFNRGPLLVVPNPMARYGESEAIPVYFEVYNLETLEDGSAEYTVSYRLIPKTPRPLGLFEFSRDDDEPLDVSSRFTARAHGQNDVVHLAIGSENLWPGRYALEVTVTDETSNAQVSHEVEFEVGGDLTASAAGR
jgi:GWxTD domain-containing protein